MMLCREEVAYRFVMLAQGGMYYTTVEQNLGGVGDAIEGLESLLEFVIIIMAECRYPGFDLL